MSAHTPGPWFTDLSRRQARGAIGIFAHDGVACVATCEPGCLSEEGRQDAVEANARLIAAAPDMLAALQALLMDAKGSGWNSVDAARIAIAKAQP